MIQIAYIDLETNGLPVQKNGEFYHYGQTQFYENARIIEIAVVIKEYKLNKDMLITESKVIQTHNHIIKPEKFSITNDKFHGITEEMAITKGCNFDDIIDDVITSLEQCHLLIAHNIQFDKNVLLSELYRRNKKTQLNKLLKIKTFCTSKQCADVTRIRRFDGCFKQPKLVELYYFLFKEFPVQNHRALDDTNMLISCFEKLIEKKLIRLS